MARQLPVIEHVYQNFVMDSSRWDDFRARPGDVFVCTAYKAGTTWTQMICALLIKQTPSLGTPIGEVSPWLDMVTRPIDQILALLEAQTDRRFIKTHTPLDGIPYFDDAVYLFCGRDPRDVFISMLNHQQNIDFEAFGKMIADQGIEMQTPDPDLPTDLNELFHMWLTRGSFEWESDGFPFWSMFHHAETFWRSRHLPNMHFLHYADMKTDLDGEMRRVAEIIDAPTDSPAWPDLVNAATFEAMKANADTTAPDAHMGTWQSNTDFFKTGSVGQWRRLLNDESLALYDTVKYERMAPTLADWLEQGSQAGDPKAM